jgi:hypothetical protein
MEVPMMEMLESKLDAIAKACRRHGATRLDDRQPAVNRCDYQKAVYRSERPY